ncbi:hypothetical protein XU18_4466 [Perkinsela sp. CCAP 1560/4]|nr:hypothetical protein XU18_4466 [Perkinsela sp. CCAP 1560/4]|eukprot:KNH04256.1 hypothetical protein XU18_4466 [Perkinsela sp. CCAP 1560/4]
MNHSGRLFGPTRICLAVHTRYNQFDTTYPYAEPFAGTPYENRAFRPRSTAYPAWMDQGIDGYGQGIGIYRSHRLSKLSANMQRNRDNIPYYIRRMTQGVFHASGRKLVYKGGKLPDPTRVPVRTGHPSALTRYVHTEKHLIRKFPQGDPLKDPAEGYEFMSQWVKRASGSDLSMPPSTDGNGTYPKHRFTTHPLYKPYVALHEAELFKDSNLIEKSEKEIQSNSKPDTEKKPLRKRFFFMS